MSSEQTHTNPPLVVGMLQRTPSNVPREISSAPPTKINPNTHVWGSVKRLHKQLSASQQMFEAVLEDNQLLRRERSRIDNEKILLAKMVERRKEREGLEGSMEMPAMEQDVEQDLKAMQAQLKLTCQEIITLRRSAGAKDVEMASLRQEIFRLQERHVAESENVSNEVIELREKNKKLQEEFRQAKAKNMSLEAQLKDARDENHQIKDNLREMEDRTVQLEKELMDEKTVLQNIRHDKDLSRATIIDLENRLREAETVIYEAHEEKEGLQKVADRLADDLLEAAAAADNEAQRADDATKALKISEVEWQKESESLRQREREHDAIVKKLEQNLVQAAEDVLNSERKERDQMRAMEEDAERLRKGLEAAKEHITMLCAERDTLKDEAGILRSIAEDSQAKCDEAVRKMNGTFKHIAQKAQEALQRLLEESIRQQRFLEQRNERLEEKIHKRDAEIEWLRGVWRSLLIAHPEKECLDEALQNELKQLSKEKKILQVQLEDSEKHSDQLAVVVAMQYLRLVIANWRRPGYQNSLKRRLNRVKDEVDHEDMEASEAAGEKPGDIAQNMMRSIRQEKDKRERLAVSLLPNVPRQTSQRDQELIRQLQLKHQQHWGTPSETHETNIQDSLHIEAALLGHHTPRPHSRSPRKSPSHSHTRSSGTSDRDHTHSISPAGRNRSFDGVLTGELQLKAGSTSPYKQTSLSAMRALAERSREEGFYGTQSEARATRQMPRSPDALPTPVGYGDNFNPSEEEMPVGLLPTQREEWDVRTPNLPRSKALMEGRAKYCTPAHDPNPPAASSPLVRGIPRGEGGNTPVLRESVSAYSPKITSPGAHVGRVNGYVQDDDLTRLEKLLEGGRKARTPLRGVGDLNGNIQGGLEFVSEEFGRSESTSSLPVDLEQERKKRRASDRRKSLENALSRIEMEEEERERERVEEAERRRAVADKLNESGGGGGMRNVTDAILNVSDKTYKSPIEREREALEQDLRILKSKVGASNDIASESEDYERRRRIGRAERELMLLEEIEAKEARAMMRSFANVNESIASSVASGTLASRFDRAESGGGGRARSVDSRGRVVRAYPLISDQALSTAVKGENLKGENLGSSVWRGGRRRGDVTMPRDSSMTYLLSPPISPTTSQIMVPSPIYSNIAKLSPTVSAVERRSRTPTRRGRESSPLRASSPPGNSLPGNSPDGNSGGSPPLTWGDWKGQGGKGSGTGGDKEEGRKPAVSFEEMKKSVSPEMEARQRRTTGEGFIM